MLHSRVLKEQINMSRPNTLTNPEQLESARQVFDLIDGLEPERNAAFTAIDQISGTKLAKLFLQGYARHLAINAEERIDDPLAVAIGNISYMTGYYTSGSDPVRSQATQHTDLMRPWREAHDELLRELG
jgi:hypothetical protein